MNLGDEHEYNLPNALFLADVLERSAQSHTQAVAAAELRRLYAELERCKQVCAATSEAWRKEAALAEPVQEPQCNPHPKAPHGFLRNASHNADRYVCECDGWEPYEAGYQAGMEAALRAQS